MTLPDKLRVINGKVFMANGDDPTEYLKEWANRTGVTATTPINIMPTRVIDDLLWEQHLMRVA